MEKSSGKHHSRYLPDADREPDSRQFKGIRIRKWGRWVSEIRMPKTREKIWLGSYKTAEQAARAYDVGVYCLRGPNAKFNFPDSVPAIPSASSLSRQQIQVAAAKYALKAKCNFPDSVSAIPSASSISRQQIQVAAAKYALDAKFNFPDPVPTIPSPSTLSRQQTQVAAAEYALDEIPLPNLQKTNNKATETPISLSRPTSISEMELSHDSQQICEAQDLGLLDSPFYGNGGLNLEKIPSLDEVWALDFIPSWQEEQQQDDIFFDGTDLWSFWDI